MDDVIKEAERALVNSGAGVWAASVLATRGTAFGAQAAHMPITLVARSKAEAMGRALEHYHERCPDISGANGWSLAVEVCRVTDEQIRAAQYLYPPS